MRAHLAIVFAFSLLVSCLQGGPCLAAPRQAPNILWLSCEDIGPHLGCYGDPDAHTPNLDKLAEKGIRYTRAFTVAPVCSPNRSCIITGVYPTALGTQHMRSGGEGRDRSNEPALPPEVSCFTRILQANGYYCTNNAKEDYNFPTPDSAWNDSSARAHWRNRPDDGSPFFAVFNYTGTHEGSVRSRPDRFANLTRRLHESERRAPSTVSVPPYHPDTPVVRRQWANYHELITGFDYWVADRLKELEEDGLADSTIVFFWSDHGAGLPRNKRWLYDSGVHVPLIVYLPEKWSEEFNMEPGTKEDRLVSSVDFAPTVLNLLGLSIPKYMQGRAFLGANQPSPRTYVFGGRDRMDERYDVIRMVRDGRFKYIRNYEPFKPYHQFMNTAEKSPVQQDIHRLAQANALPAGVSWATAATKPIEELYDVQNDPHELINLADDDAYDADLTRMRNAHKKWQLRTNDLGLIPEPELARLEKSFGYRYRIAEGLSQDDPVFFRDLSRMATLAGQPTRESVAPLVQGSLNAHPSIRYWAATGLGNVSVRDDRVIEALRRGMRDSAAVVRVAAALALCKAGRDAQEPLEVLVHELGSEAEWIRLAAATALDEIGELAGPAIPALREALEDRENKYVVRVANHALNSLLGENNEVR